MFGITVDFTLAFICVLLSVGKNPDVDTSFLPDRDREEEENRLRYVQ